MQRLRLAVPSLLLVAFAAPLAAQRPAHRFDDRDDWLAQCRRNADRDRDDGSRVRFCEERAMGWSARSGTSLTVDASPNGGVSVSGWDKDSVHVIVRIETRAGSEDEAQSLAQQIRISNEHGTLQAEGPGSRRWASWTVSYEIFAPAHTDLSLSTVNGPLEVEDVVGSMDLSATNGPLALTRLGGDVRAHAQNGPLSVELDGSQWSGAGLDAETQNGPLTLDIPEGYNAELETGTINGPMEFGFPITVQGRIGLGGHRWLSTRLGAGGPKIRAVTTNGPATIRRS